MALADAQHARMPEEASSREESNPEEHASMDSQGSSSSNPEHLEAGMLPRPAASCDGLPTLLVSSWPAARRGGKLAMTSPSGDDPKAVACGPPSKSEPPAPVLPDSEQAVAPPLAPEKPAGPPAKRPREFVFDNAKFFLTLFVVGEHTLNVFNGHRWFSTWCHDASYVYLMPTYVFISGFFSSTDLSRAKKVDGVIKVATIYFLCQLLFTLVIFYGKPLFHSTPFGPYGFILTHHNPDGEVHGQWSGSVWVYSYWHLWYLQYLAIWRFALPFWWRLRYPVVTAWVFCAFFFGFEVAQVKTDLVPMKINQVVGWFPLVCLGAAAKERGCALWEHRFSRFLGLAVLAVVVWAPHFTKLENEDSVFTINGIIWSYGGDTRKLDPVTGTGLAGCCWKTLIRLAAPLVHVVAIWAVMHVLPREEWRVITSFGTRAVANYVLHPFSGLLISALGLYGPRTGKVGDIATSAPAWAEVGVVALIVLTSLFWMSPWVWKLVWPLFDPPIHWLLKPQA